MFENKPLIKEKYHLLVCGILLIGYFIPYFILGELFPITIHDNLDSNVVWSKLILENNQFFSYKNNQVPQLMNGCVQLSYSGDISFLFFKLFGMYWGYVVNKILMALVGFTGMYLLLKKHIVPGSHNTLIHSSVGLTYAILPFWSFTVSVAGLPIALYAILNTRKEQTQWYNWAILIVFSFYSHFVISTFFFLVVISSIWLIDFITTKKGNKYFFISIVVLTISSVVSNFPLFYTFLFPSNSISHRFEFSKESISFSRALELSRDIFINGQYHAQSLHLWMFPAIVLSFFFIRNRWIEYKKLFSILIFLILTSLFYGFINWGHIKVIFDKLMNIVPIQWQRFHFLHPICWFLVFAISLSVIVSKFRFGKFIAAVFIVIEFCFVLYHHEYIANIDKPGYTSFYAEDLFTQIKNSIGKKTSEYRVINVGIHPAVSQYNGFYTLDAYVPTYPLNYKHKFRKIIEPELNKNEELKKYFDNWGSRCYAFSSELGKNFLFGKGFESEVKRLDYNLEEFKKMGGVYIISAVEINAEHNRDLFLKGIFSNDNSYYKIFLYEVLK